MFDGLSSFALLIYAILLLLTLILVTLIVLLVHSGLFRAIDEVGTGSPPIGQVIIAYKFQKGPYNEAGQIFTEAAIIAPGNKALGIYYDDPNKVESSNLRYIVGSVLSEGAAPVNEDMVKSFTDKDFKILHLPEVTFAVSTRFPHITTLSVLIAIHKAYPRMKEYIEERKLCAYPFIEYYDGNTIHFMAPLSKQEEFFVPECEQEARGDQPSQDFDTTELNTSHSTFDNSMLSQDITQTTLDDDSVDREESTLLTPGKTDVEVDEEDKNGNNGGENEDSLKISQDDEQASDDSGSSFEVLKTESVE